MTRAIFDASRGTYGARRLRAALAASGWPASTRLVRRLMRSLGLRACQPRPYRAHHRADAAAAHPADRLGGDFTAAAPGSKLVGDIS